MMTVEQVVSWVAGIGAVVLGGGGIAALIVAFANRKIGLRTTENDANKTINTTWEAIVADLQGQIVAGREEFAKQLTAINAKVDKLQVNLEERDRELHAKDRLLLIAIGHIGKLELMIPPKPVPDRPEGLQ